MGTGSGAGGGASGGGKGGAGKGGAAGAPPGAPSPGKGGAGGGGKSGSGKGGSVANQYSGGGVNAANDMQNAFGNMEGQVSGAMNPWTSGGSNWLNQYAQGLQGMSDPQSFINKMMQGYQESPQAKYQVQQGIKTANAADTASGMLGSGAEQTALQQQGQGIVANDQQNYLNNAMGVYNQYLGGMGGLQQQSMGANEWTQNLLSQLGTQAAQAQAQGDQAQAQGKNAAAGGLGSGKSGGGKGGASGGKGGAGGGGKGGSLGGLAGGAAGTMVGGPIGGKVGSMAGNEIGGAL